MIASIQALLTTLAISFDLPILDWIQEHLVCKAMDIAMPIVTLFGASSVRPTVSRPRP